MASPSRPRRRSSTSTTTWSPRRAAIRPTFPTTWDGIFELSQKIAKLGDGNIGLFHSWAITGNWMWQALVYSHGGKMMSDDEKTVAFDQDAGKKSIALLGRMVREGGMPDLTPEASRAAFFSGKLGIWTEVDIAAARRRRRRRPASSSGAPCASRCPAPTPGCRPAARRR